MAHLEVLIQDLQAIKKRISQSEVEEALEELSALLPHIGLSLEDDVLALQQQFNYIQKQHQLNLIEHSEYARTLNNISFALLRLITATCKALQQQQPQSGSAPSAGLSITDTEPLATPTQTEIASMLQEGQQKMAKGDYSGALQLFSEYLQAHPRSWQAMHHLGSLYETLGLWEEAVYWYSEVLKVNPADAIALNNRGNIRMEQLEAYEKAYKDFSTALLADPQLQAARYNRALAAMNLRRYSEAIADLDECIRQNFMVDTCRGLRGVSLAAVGRHAEAAEDLKLALRADPNNATYWATYGLCEYEHGLYREAIQTLNHALSLNPHQPEMQNVRGMSHFFLKDYPAAQADFEAVARQKPDYAYGWYFLGLCRKIQGDPESAIQYLREALQQNPQLAEAYAILGVIAYEHDQFNEAIRLCEQALALHPDLEVAQEFLQKARQAQRSGGLWNKLFGG